MPSKDQTLTAATAPLQAVPLLRIPVAMISVESIRLRAEAHVRHVHVHSASPVECVSLEAESKRMNFSATRDKSFAGSIRCGALVGATRFVRANACRLRHRGGIWGAYVAPDLRGQSNGAALMCLLLADCLRPLGLEQGAASFDSESGAAQQLFVGTSSKCWGTLQSTVKVDDPDLGEHYLLRGGQHLREDARAPAFTFAGKEQGND
jgi:ribosomal protein S18 acetylase RimI-like enzyme